MGKHDCNDFAYCVHTCISNMQTDINIILSMEHTHADTDT